MASTSTVCLIHLTGLGFPLTARPSLGLEPWWTTSLLVWYTETLSRKACWFLPQGLYVVLTASSLLWKKHQESSPLCNSHHFLESPKNVYYLSVLPHTPYTWILISTWIQFFAYIFGLMMEIPSLATVDSRDQTHIILIFFFLTSGETRMSGSHKPLNLWYFGT